MKTPRGKGHGEAPRAPAHGGVWADDDGFLPGLKARPHAGSAAEFLARCDREPEAAGGAGKEAPAPLEEWEQLARRVLRRPAGGGGEPRREAPHAARRSPPARREREARDSEELTPEMKRHLRRLAGARRNLAAFEPANAQHRELLGLLRAMLHFMVGRLHRPGGPQALERWWPIFLAFRRALDLPELTGPRRRAAFEKLMQLQAADLFAVARRGRLGRRMPDKKSTRRRRRRCVLR